MSRRTGIVVATALAGLLLLPGVGWACGGLVGENGTIQLVRTTTLAAHADGVQHYVTAFQFTGEGESVGSIVPLPDVPTSVERGGDWTLPRLVREVAPRERAASEASEERDAADGVEIVLETQVDALDITVLKGGGAEVGRWAVENGFFLSPDAPEVLDFYARRSPVFMAARFDARRAAELGQGAGDSTPIMATIPTDRPWVPLRILALGLDGSQRVEADVVLLTERRPELLIGGPGLTVERSEQASTSLLDDLRADAGMEWMPRDMWLTYLPVDAAAADLDYDLAVSVQPDVEPSLVHAGIGPAAAVPPVPASGGQASWPAPLGAAAGALAFAALTLQRRRRAPSAG